MISVSERQFESDYLSSIMQRQYAPVTTINGHSETTPNLMHQSYFIRRIKKGVTAVLLFW